jgi:two-component system chemotaxis response regulator CheB
MTTRVLIVDDSPVARRFLAAILATDTELQVIGQAEDGAQAVALTTLLRPDVVVLDLNLPDLLGHEVTQQIMTTNPTRIVICTGGTTGADALNSYEAIKAGALAAVEKPENTADEPRSRQLLSTIRLIRDVPLRVETPGEERAPVLVSSYSQYWVKAVGIVASTGGPAVLQAVLSRLPGDFPLPILVVQHRTAGFADGLAEWLGRNIAIPVHLARHGEHLQPNCVLIAPDDYHLRINPLRQIELTQTSPVRGQRPAATVLFQSLANVYGAAVLGVVLDHTGLDGLEACYAVTSSNGRIVVQQPVSEAGLPDAYRPHLVPTEKLADAILEQIA